MQHRTYIIAIIKTINGDFSISHGDFGDFRGDFGDFLESCYPSGPRSAIGSHETPDVAFRSATPSVDLTTGLSRVMQVTNQTA